MGVTQRYTRRELAVNVDLTSVGATGQGPCFFIRIEFSDITRLRTDARALSPDFDEPSFRLESELRTNGKSQTTPFDPETGIFAKVGNCADCKRLLYRNIEREIPVSIMRGPESSGWPQLRKCVDVRQPISGLSCTRFAYSRPGPGQRVALLNVEKGGNLTGYAVVPERLLNTGARRSFH